MEWKVGCLSRSWEGGGNSCCYCCCCWRWYCLGAPVSFVHEQALCIYHAWLAAVLHGNRCDSSRCSCCRWTHSHDQPSSCRHQIDACLGGECPSGAALRRVDGGDDGREGRRRENGFTREVMRRERRRRSFILHHDPMPDVDCFRRLWKVGHAARMDLLILGGEIVKMTGVSWKSCQKFFRKAF